MMPPSSGDIQAKALFTEQVKESLREVIINSCSSYVTFVKFAQLTGTIKLSIDNKPFITFPLNDLVIHAVSNDGSKSVCLLTSDDLTQKLDENPENTNDLEEDISHAGSQDDGDWEPPSKQAPSGSVDVTMAEPTIDTSKTDQSGATCPFCDIVLSDERYLSDHLKLVHGKDVVLADMNDKDEQIEEVGDVSDCDETLDHEFADLDPEPEDNINEETVPVVVRADVYSCSKCKYTCKHYSSFVGHMEKHQEIVYICRTCGKDFSDNHVHQAHEEYHTENNCDEVPCKALLKCPICSNTYKGHINLMVHVKRHKGQMARARVKCKTCGKLVAEQHLKSHELLHNGMLPHKCPECPQRFRFKISMRKHCIKEHNYEKNIAQCKLCDKSFLNYDSLTSHMKYHEGLKPHMCPVCSKVFKYQLNLEQHLKKWHHVKIEQGENEEVSSKSPDSREKRKYTEKKLTCEKCSYTCSREESLLYHNYLHTVSPTACSVCKDTISDPVVYEQHTKLHAIYGRSIPESAVYRCLTCEKEFKRPISLGLHALKAHRENVSQHKVKCEVCLKEYGEKYISQHRRMHSGEKKFTCDLCDECFIFRGQLIQHRVKIHNEEKPIKCPLCTRRFLAQDSLKAHMKLNSGEKPLECETCYKCFKTSSGLWNHCVKVHKVEDPDSPKKLKKSAKQKKKVSNDKKK